MTSNSTYNYIFFKKLKTCVHPKAYKQLFMAALCIIAKVWKQPECPTNDNE